MCAGRQRRTADPAERGSKKGNPLFTVRTEATIVAGNQQIVTGQTTGRKKKIDNATEKSVQDYIPSLKLFNPVASSGIYIRGTSAQRRSRS